jgi:transcriptional regulator with XRE-family HTH domain
MEEKVVNELLLRGIRRGDMPFECSDNVVDRWFLDATSHLSDEVKLSVRTKLKHRLQDAALLKSGQSLEIVVVPLGRLIERIRKGARLTLTDIAERLGRPGHYVREIEESDAAVPPVSTQEFADLMQLFHLKYSRISEIVRRSIDSLGLGRIDQWSEAATNGLQMDKNREHLRESRNTLEYKRQQKNTQARDSAESWLVSLEGQLRSRGRTDLLG